jgi:signal transduction histidine kinase
MTILLLVVIGSLIGYSLATANVESARARSIDRWLRENELRVSNMFDSYAHLSWGSTGQLESGNVDEQSWQRFVSVYNLEDNFPSVEAIALSQGNTPQDNKIISVVPQTPATNQAIGTNIGSFPSTEGAMEQAAKTGQTIVTDTLPQVYSTKENDNLKKKGFIMFTPFYDPALPRSTTNERLSALRGYTMAMFRGDLFFSPAFKDIDLDHTKMQIYLGEPTEANLLYQVGTTTEKDTRTVKQELREYGKTFTIIYTLDTAYILQWLTTYFPQVLLFGGLFFGLLFAAISGIMLRSRFSRLTYEKERDVEFAKDELLSLASHQLRTPATGVKQYLGMVLQGFAGDVNTKQREYLERAYASNNRQLGVINDILHLAKLETGRIVLAERKFDLAKMVRDVVDEQREQAERGEIKLELEAPSHGAIVGDSHMLRMVIENLLSNAIKYTPVGGTVTVKMSRRANRWLIMVKDTGVGISKSDFPKLFKQFSRINNPRTEFVTGTGVGLYLSYHLTILHGGSIGVSSRKGRGSTFTVRLPRKL